MEIIRKLYILTPLISLNFILIIFFHVYLSNYIFTANLF